MRLQSQAVETHGIFVYCNDKEADFSKNIYLLNMKQLFRHIRTNQYRIKSQESMLK